MFSYLRTGREDSIAQVVVGVRWHVHLFSWLLASELLFISSYNKTEFKQDPDLLIICCSPSIRVGVKNSRLNPLKWLVDHKISGDIIA